MNTVVECILKHYVKKKELYVKNVHAQSIIGFNQNGSGNVLNAVSEQHYEVERSWSQPSCHSTNGICAWRL
jgi:hypothetical protein